MGSQLMTHDRLLGGGTRNSNDGNLRLNDCELKALLMTMYATSVKVQRNLVVRLVGLRKRSNV